jgi:hypothetical protein
MKKDEVPQDQGMLGGQRELCYAVDEQGRSVTVHSLGWVVKEIAIAQAWELIHEQIALAKDKIARGECSALVYHMAKNQMNVAMMSQYSGFYHWQIKLHLKPKVFNRLKPSVLKRYAEAFNISVDQLLKTE